MTNQSNKSSPRKELRTSEADWRGMSSSHRRHTKPYTRTKQNSFGGIVKTILIAVILVMCMITLYDMNQLCEERVGPNSAICTD